jgi:hypothetical protein
MIGLILVLFITSTNTVGARTLKKPAKFWLKGNERREKGTAEVRRPEPGGLRHVWLLIRALSHTSQPILPLDSYETMPSILHSLLTPFSLCCTLLMLLVLSHQCLHCSTIVVDDVMNMVKN